MRFERLEERNLLTTNVNLFISQETALENGSAPALFGLERSGDGLDQSLTVEYSLGGTAMLGGTATLDADYHTGSGSVTFAPYQTSLTLSVSPVDDDALEGPETVVVSLAPSEQYTSQTDSVTLTILDDEVNHAPSFTAGANLVVRDDAGPQAVAAWATNIAAGPANEACQSLAFLVETDNAALFSSQPSISADGTLAFTPNSGAFGVATVTVRLQDNGGTQSAGTGESGYDTSAPQMFTISIGPTLAINDVSVSEAGDTATFTIALSHATTAPVIVDWQVQNGSAAATVDFWPQVWTPGYEVGHWQPGYDVSPYTVTDGYYQPGYDVNAYNVLVGYWQPGYEVNGYYDEFNNFISGFWSPGEYLDPAWTNGCTYGEHWIDEGSYSVLAFWSAGETIDPAWVNGCTPRSQWIDTSYTAGGAWVAATSPDDAWVNGYTYNEHWIVDGWVEADWSDAYSGQLTIAPGETSATIRVRMLNDELFEGDETFAILLTSASGAFIADAVGEGAILDDEFNRAPSFTAGANVVVSDDAGPQSIAGWATNIAAGAANEGHQALTFLVEVDDASLFSAMPQIAANGTLSFTPTAGAFGVATVTVRLQDDGGTATNSLGSTGVDTSAPQAFTIAIGPALAINNVSASEADGTATFTVTLSRAVDQQVSVDWSAVDNSAARPADYSPQVWIDGYQAGHAEPGYNVNNYWAEEGYWQNGYDVNSYWVTSGYWQPGYDVNGYTVDQGHWQAGYDVNPYWAEDGYWLPGFDVAGYTDENNMWVEPFWAAGETPSEAWTGGYTSNPHWVSTGWHWAGGTWIAAEEPDATWVNGYTPSSHWIDDGSYTVQPFWSEGETIDPAWVNGYTYSPHWIDTSHGGGGTWIAADVPDPEWINGYNQSPHWVVTGGHWTGDFWVAATSPDAAWTSGYTYHEQWIDDGWVDGYWQDTSGGQLTFAAGETEKTIRVRLVNDTLVETAETYSLLLSNPTGAYVADAQGLGTIVDDENRAPTLNLATMPRAGLASQDSTLNTGILVKDFISSDRGAAAVVDDDSLIGIAIVRADNSHGAWQYSLDGDTWHDLGTPAVHSARLLAADAVTRVRFAPEATFVGTIFDAIAFRGWDQSTGTNGSIADTTQNGEATAFSTATLSASVEAVPPPTPNQAPTPQDHEIQVKSGRTLLWSVLTNDMDPDLDAVTIQPFSGETEHGRVELRADGTFVYRSHTDFSGVDHFTYTVKDERGGEATATVTINVQPLPVVSIYGGNVNEDAGSATFNVELSQAFDEAVTINWATYGDSALSGEDYSAAAGQLIFAPGETQKSISVDVLDNVFANFGADKKFHIGISTPSNAKVYSAAAQATILDDDVAVAVGYTFPGGASGVAGPFEVRLSQASDQVIEVAYSTSGTSVIAATSGTLTFAPGVTSQSIAIELPDDEPGVDRAPEVMTISLSSAQNAAIYVGESKAIIDGLTWHTEEQEVWYWNPEHEWVPESSYEEYDEFGNLITIIVPAHWVGGDECDIETVWVSEVDTFYGPWAEIASAQASETDGYVRFTVHVYGNTAEEPVMVNWATLYGSAMPDDFTPNSGSLTIQDGDTSATFDVAITRDGIREAAESFYVYVTSITAAGHTYGSNYSLAAAGTIHDVWTNIAVDSDNDGLLGSDADEVLEEGSLGRIVGVNDSNLTRVDLNLASGQSNLSVWLHADHANKIRLWETADRQNELFLDVVLAIGHGHMTKTVYVEGLESGDVTLTLAAGYQVGTPMVDDPAHLRVVKLDGYKLQAVEIDGTWRDVADDEGLMEFDELRWLPEGISVDMSPFVRGIDWVYTSRTDPNDTWHLFAQTDTLTFVRGSLPVGLWYVQPRVRFAGGAESMLVQQGAGENRGAAKVEWVADLIVTWFGLEMGGAPSNFQIGGIDKQYGGGDAFFPEKLNPGEREESAEVRRNYDKVGIKVMLNGDFPPEKDQITVKLLVKDPDHYSNDPEFDTNDDANHVNTPDDNVIRSRLNYAANPAEEVKIWSPVGNLGAGAWADAYHIRTIGPLAETPANLNSAVVTLRKDTPTEEYIRPNGEIALLPTVRLAFQINEAHPTNNYRAVVFGALELVNIQFDEEDGKTIKLYQGDREVVLPSIRQTSILSVMRTLYVETDSMTTPDLDLTPNASRIAGGNIVSNSVNGRAFQINQPIEERNANQFAGGQITLYNSSNIALGVFDVTSNGFGVTPTITLLQDVPTNAVRFENLIDDDFAHGVTAGDMRVDTSLWASRLAPAFIRVNTTRTDLGVSNNQNANEDDLYARLNFGNSTSTNRDETGSFGDVLDSTVLYYRQSRVDDKFWTVYMVGAFQSPLPVDGDHGDDFGNGITAAVGGSANVARYQSYGRVSIISRETIRDNYEFYSHLYPNAQLISEQQLAALVSVHELGHVIGILGDDAHDRRYGTIMDVDATRALLDSTSSEYGVFTIDKLTFAGAGLRRMIEFIPGYDRY